MALKGQVKIVLSAQQCSAAARWLETYRPPPPSLLGNLCAQRIETVNAKILLAKFAKCGRRQARPNAIRIVPWELAHWFGQQLDWYIMRRKFGILPLPILVIEAMQACRTATSRKRGRPRIERNEAELAALHFAEDNRHYQRQLKRRARYQWLWAEWSARLTARGETLVTSSELPPML